MYTYIFHYCYCYCFCYCFCYCVTCLLDCLCLSKMRVIVCYLLLSTVGSYYLLLFVIMCEYCILCVCISHIVLNVNIVYYMLFVY